VQVDLARGAAFFVLLAVFTGVVRLATRKAPLTRRPVSGIANPSGNQKSRPLIGYSRFDPDFVCFTPES
jgi:hypothetical protein